MPRLELMTYESNGKRCIRISLVGPETLPPVTIGEGFDATKVTGYQQSYTIANQWALLLDVDLDDMVNGKHITKKERTPKPPTKKELSKGKPKGLMRGHTRPGYVKVTQRMWAPIINKMLKNGGVNVACRDLKLPETTIRSLRDKLTHDKEAGVFWAYWYRLASYAGISKIPPSAKQGKSE